MADIFLANDQVLERLVVIKMLLPQYAADPAFVERFRREATSAAKLNHRNVVAVYDWGSNDDTFYMAMEYIDGRSLAEVLVASPKLPLETALAITSEAAAGLGFAHDNGMVHRDVKPGNIMLTEEGGVKVADFGIARAMDGGESLTQTGNVMGTAAYFSPEQARGESVDRRSDLYSLGVVLFEMATGQRPFSGSSPVSVAYKHVGEAPPRPTAIDGSLPPFIDAVLATLLAKDPNERYADAEELRAELQRVGAGETPHGPASVPQQAAGASAAAATLAAGYAGAQDAEATAMLQTPHPGPPPGDEATAMLAPERRPDGRAPAPPPRRGGSGNGFFIMILAALVIAAIVLIVVIATTLSGDTSSGDPTTTTAEGVPESSEPEQTTSTPAESTTTAEESSTTTEPEESTTTEESSTSSTSASTTSSTSTTSTTTTTSTSTSTTTTTTSTTTTTTEDTTTTASDESTTTPAT